LNGFDSLKEYIARAEQDGVVEVKNRNDPNGQVIVKLAMRRAPQIQEDPVPSASAFQDLIDILKASKTKCLGINEISMSSRGLAAKHGYQSLKRFLYAAERHGCIRLIDRDDKDGKMLVRLKKNPRIIGLASGVPSLSDATVKMLQEKIQVAVSTVPNSSLNPSNSVEMSSNSFGAASSTSALIITRGMESTVCGPTLFSNSTTPTAISKPAATLDISLAEAAFNSASNTSLSAHLQETSRMEKHGASCLPPGLTSPLNLGSSNSSLARNGGGFAKAVESNFGVYMMMRPKLDISDIPEFTLLSKEIDQQVSQLEEGLDVNLERH
jgi:hypothetical protein